MRFLRLLLVAGFAGLALSSGSVAQPSPPPAVPAPPGFQIEWKRRPGEYDMYRALPGIAARLRIAGYAMLLCRVTVDGTLVDCIAEAETPRGLGFGAGALSLAPRFKAKPLPTDLPAGCCLVRIPVRFGVGASERRPAEPPPARSPEALARALQVIDRIGYVERIMKWPEEDWPDNQLTPPASRDAALLALRDAQVRQMPQARETLARAVAAAFTDEELVRLVDSNPTMARLRLRLRVDVIESAIELVNRQVAAEARQAYCDQHDCTPPPSPAMPRRPG